MKILTLVSTLAATLFLATGCGGRKDEETKPVKPDEAAAEASGAVTPPAPGVEPPPVPAVPVEEIASMIGFASRLPADFETLVMVDVGAFRKIFGGGDAEEGALDAEEEEESPVVVEEGAGPMDALFRGKVMLAGGPGVTENSSRFFSIFMLFQKAAFRETLIDLGYEAGVIPEDLYESSDAASMVFTNHFEQLMRNIEGIQVPPLVAAVELPDDGEVRNEIVSMLDAQITGMVEELPFLNAVPEDQVGVAGFKLFSLKAGDVVGREEVGFMTEDHVDEASGQRMYEAVSGIPLTFGYGVVGGNLVFYAGSTPQGLRLVDRPEESMAGRPEMEVIGDARGCLPLMVLSLSKGMMDLMRHVNDSAYFFEVFAEVLKLTNGMGDVSDLVALVESAAGHWSKLYAGNDTAFGGVLWQTEDSWRFEGLGGFDSPTVDTATPLTLLPAVDQETAMMVFAGNSTVESRAIARELIADVVEFLEEMMVRYLGTAASDEDSEMRKELERFRTRQLPAAKVAYEAIFNDIEGALDGQLAVVVDNGPPIHKMPGLPEEMEGRFPLPRVAVMRGVANRGELQEGWKKLEPALKDLWAMVPMDEEVKPGWPEAIDSERDGVRSWFYAFSGITTNDFMPVVTVHDEVLVLASSRNLSESLVSRWKSADRVQAVERGLYFRMNFAPLHETMKSLPAGETDVEDDMEEEDFEDFGAMGMFAFFETLPQRATDLAGGLESLTWRHTPEGARWRSSVELKRRVAE